MVHTFSIHPKSRRNKKSPNFAQQSGLLFGMSQKLGKTSLLVIPADQDRENIGKDVQQQCNCSGTINVFNPHQKAGKTSLLVIPAD